MEMVRELLQKKAELVAELGRLSTSLLQFSVEQLVQEEEAAQQFAGLMDQRQEVMEQIDRLDAQLGQAGGAEGDELQELKEEMLAGLRRIEAETEQVEGLIKGALAQLKGQARKIQTGKQSNRAYIGAVPSVEGSFIDKRR